METGTTHSDKVWEGKKWIDPADLEEWRRSVARMLHTPTPTSTTTDLNYLENTRGE